jgi:hypothetical protein
MSKIIVHNGGAHADELWACAALIAVDPRIDQVLRSGDATHLTIDDYVVDVGGRFNPLTKSYDHHQKDPAVKGECAFSLVVKSNTLLSSLAQQNSGFAALVQRIALQDNSGLGKVGEIVGSIDNALSLIQAEFALVRLFEQSPFATALMLAEYVRELITEAQKITDLTENLLAWARMTSDPIHIVKFGSVNVLYLADFDMYGVTARTFTKAIGNTLAIIGKETPIHATVSLSAQDTQNPGHLTIFRTKFGEGKLDLSKPVNDTSRPTDEPLEFMDRYALKAAIQFQHAAGFLMILKKGQEHYWAQAIRNCLI